MCVNSNTSSIVSPTLKASAMKKIRLGFGDLRLFLITSIFSFLVLNLILGLSNPLTPISKPLKAFCNDSWKLRPIDITSPTDFICVVS